jgi:toxin ParE1/3/4
VIRLVLRPAARHELVEIWLYTADQWGADQADTYIRDIQLVIGRALAFPDAGSPVEGLPREYRKLASGSHRIVYRHTDQELVVVRVLHARQDVPDELE